jgi:hypothetical protein
MITKILINADGIDVRDEGDNVEVIKKPPCFFAYRDKASVSYRKVNNDGIVDSSLRAQKIPLANFLVNFKSFNGDLEIPQDFNKDVFFFLGQSGLRKDSAMTMPSAFYITDCESGDVNKFEKGDILITTKTGLNIAITLDEFANQYITEDKLHLFIKPDIQFVNKKEASYSLNVT